MSDVRVTPCVLVDEGSVQLDAVRAGLGVSAFFGMQVSEELTSGALVRVAPKWRIATTVGIYAVYPHRTLMPRRARVFLDLLTEELEPLVSVWNAQAS